MCSDEVPGHLKMVSETRHGTSTVTRSTSALFETGPPEYGGANGSGYALGLVKTAVFNMERSSVEDHHRPDGCRLGVSDSKGSDRPPL